MYFDLIYSSNLGSEGAHFPANSLVAGLVLYSAEVLDVAVISWVVCTGAFMIITNQDANRQWQSCLNKHWWSSLFSLSYEIIFSQYQRVLIWGICECILLASSLEQLAQHNCQGRPQSMQPVQIQIHLNTLATCNNALRTRMPEYASGKSRREAEQPVVSAASCQCFWAEYWRVSAVQREAGSQAGRVIRVCLSPRLFLFLCLYHRQVGGITDNGRATAIRWRGICCCKFFFVLHFMLFDITSVTCKLQESTREEVNLNSNIKITKPKQSNIRQCQSYHFSSNTTSHRKICVTAKG